MELVALEAAVPEAVRMVVVVTVWEAAAMVKVAVVMVEGLAGVEGAAVMEEVTTD